MGDRPNKVMLVTQKGWNLTYKLQRELSVHIFLIG